jgi:hypothetical protein
MRAQLRRQVAHSQIDYFDSGAWRFQCLSSTAIEIAVDLASMIDSPRTAMAGSARFIGECRFLGSTVTKRSLRVRETGDFAGKIAASLPRSLQPMHRTKSQHGRQRLSTMPYSNRETCMSAAPVLNSIAIREYR